MEQGSVGTAPPILDLLGRLFRQPYQCHCACHACLDDNNGGEQLMSNFQEKRIMKKLDKTLFSYQKSVAKAVGLSR
jgi:hypothetical protein